MVLNKIVNINVQRENRILFSDQNYFLYRAYTINKYSPDLIKKKNTTGRPAFIWRCSEIHKIAMTKQNFFLNSCLGYGL